MTCRIAVALLAALSLACASASPPAPESAPAPAEAAPPPPEPPPPPRQPPPPAPEPTTIPSQLYSDFKWAANNLEADGEDLITSPCHADALLHQEPSFYWTGLAAAAALGGAFALDTPLRVHTKHVEHGVADGFQSGGQIALWTATAAIYGWGVYSDDSRSRRYVLTTLFSTGIAGLITVGTKAAFGRLRPKQNQGAFQFWQGGNSFVSGETTPAFALAAGVSEWADNRWYVAVPAYGAAAAVGFGRIGKDAHWLSDVVGSALVGIGTTELLLHLHAQHDADPSRWRIFPLPVKGGSGLGVSGEF